MIYDVWVTNGRTGERACFMVETYTGDGDARVTALHRAFHSLSWNQCQTALDDCIEHPIEQVA